MSVVYLDEVRGERPGVGPPAVDVEVLLEVGVEELEDEVEDGLAVLGGLLDGEEADDVDGVGEEVEEGDLAERGGRDALLVHLEAGLLERHELARGLVLRLVHLAVGALPDLLGFSSFSYLSTMLSSIAFFPWMARRGGLRRAAKANPSKGAGF